MRNRMLCTHLLCFLIQQQAAPTATCKDNSHPNGCTTYLAGLGVKHYIQESNILLSDLKQHARKIQCIQGSVQTIATNKQSAIIFPIIESHHFYVLPCTKESTAMTPSDVLTYYINSSVPNHHYCYCCCSRPPPNLLLPFSFAGVFVPSTSIAE